MRCKGTTKAGARCKRSSSEGEEYCASHSDQVKADAAASEASASEAGAPDSSAPDSSGPDSRGPRAEEAEEHAYSDPFASSNEADTDPVFEQNVWASVAEVARVGVVIVAAVALGRWLRVL